MTDRASAGADDLATLSGDLSEIDDGGVTASDVVRASLRSEALLAEVLARAPIGFALVDHELRFELVNETLAQINGVSVEDHLGRTIREVLPDVADAVEPLLRSVLDTGEPVTGMEIAGATPAQPGIERIWSANYYRLALHDEVRAGLFVEEITQSVAGRRRAERLASIAAVLAEADTFEAIEAIVVRQIAEYFDADVAVAGHWNAESGTVTILADAAIREMVAGAAFSFDADAPYAEAARTRRVVTVANLEDRRARYGSSLAPELVAQAVVPCITGDGAFTGVMVVGWLHPIEPDAFPLPQLRTVGSLVAGAFERNRLNHQRRRLITALQETLVNQPPQRDGLETVVRYRADSDALGFGGDWYDVLPLDDSRTALIVGDVVGHDPAAAARMSQVAASIAQLLVSGTELSAVFSEAERAMAARSMTSMSTVGVVIVDTDARTLTAFSAGHLPGMLIHPDGSVHQLTPALRPPLFRFFTPTSGITPIPYAPGTKLLLYTDGLVETRRSDLARDLERLTETLRIRAADSIADLVESLLADFAPVGQQTDDIALLGAFLS
ncbi:MAG: SpoIIE family protein phosphatase [Ilumatobacteraceae bacterium]